MEPTPFGALDWAVVVFYLLGMVGIGLYVARRQENTEDFFLAGRSMPWWAVSLSVLATALSAATFIGVPQITYAAGGNLTYLILNIGEVISAFIIAALFVPVIYRAGTITIYGYLGKRYGTPSMVAASAMFLLGRLLASGARLFIAAIGFALMLYGDTEPRDLVLAILIFGVVGTVYTAFGGIRAVIWTDALQIVVVVFVAAMSVWLLLKAIPLDLVQFVYYLRNAEGGDKLQVVDTTWSLGVPYTIWAGIFASTVVSMSTFGADHDMAQRLFTTKSAWRGGLALVTSKLLGIPVVLLFLVIGLLLHVYYGRPDLMGEMAPLDVMDDSKRVFPQFLLYHMPTGVKGLAMAGLLAAALSSFDSAINAMAGTFVADIVIPLRKRRRGLEPGETRRHDLDVSRWMVVVMGVLLTVFALLAVFVQKAAGQHLIDFALGVMAYALAPLLGVFCAALFTRRGNNASVLAAFVTGIVAVTLLQPFAMPAWFDFRLGWPWVWVFATPLAFLAAVIGAPAREA